MSTTLASLGLVLDADGFIRGMTESERAMDKADKAGEKLESRSKKLGEAMKAAGAIIAGSWIAKEIISNTIEAEHAFAQLEAAVKSTGGAAGFTAEQLRDQADALQEVSTFSGEAVEGAQAILLTFTQIKGVNFTAATQAVADLATRMGGDMKGAAVQVGKALNDPINGVTALSKVGVSFSESQKEVIKKLVETGHAAEAQQVILKELSVEFGGSAEAARNTLGGALTHLKNVFGDALEAGSEFSGGMRTALDSLADIIPGIRDKFNEFVGGIQLLAVDAAVAWADFGNKFKRAIGGAMISLGEFLNNLGEWVPGLSSVAEKLNDVGNTMIQSTLGETAALQKWREEQTRAILGLGEFATKTGPAAKALTDLGGSAKVVTEEQKKHQAAIDELAESLREEIVELKGGKNALEAYKREKILAGAAPPVTTPAEVRDLAAQVKNIEQMKTALSVIPPEIVEIHEQFQLVAIDIPESTAAVLDLSGEVQKLPNLAERVSGAFKDMGNNIRQAFAEIPELFQELQRVAADLATTLTGNGFVGAAAGNAVAGNWGAVAADLFAGLADAVIHGSARFREAVREWHEAWSGFVDDLREWRNQTLGIDDPFGDLQRDVEDQLDGAFDILRNLPIAEPMRAMWNNILRQLSGSLDDLSKEGDVLGFARRFGIPTQALEDYFNALRLIADTQDKRIDQLLEEAAANGKLDEAMQQLIATFGEMPSHIQKLIDHLRHAFDPPDNTKTGGDDPGATKADEPTFGRKKKKGDGIFETGGDDPGTTGGLIPTGLDPGIDTSKLGGGSTPSSGGNSTTFSAFGGVSTVSGNILVDLERTHLTVSRETNAILRMIERNTRRGGASGPSLVDQLQSRDQSRLVDD